jgi:hypothetical protein
MNNFKPVFSAVVATAILFSCDNDNNDPVGADYSRGVYIVNEGSYTQNNGSISYFSPSAGQITNGIFESVNMRPVGDVVQSFSVVGDTTGYIVVNGSGKVEIVRLKDFKVTSAPLPVEYPRYFLQVSPDKGYLTSGSMQGKVYVVDLLSRKISGTIPVGYGPETMVALDNRVFVVNSGGWSVDSTISVVDVNTDEIISRIDVGKVPLDIALDKNDHLWVYCKGYATYSWDPPYDLISETDAMLLQIDPLTGNTIWQYSVGKAGDYTATPPKLAVSEEGDHIFYLRPEGVFKLDVQNPAISPGPLIPGMYYGLEVNPSDGNLYLFESSFTGNGIFKIYNTAGEPVAQGTVGIAPNGAVFNLDQ